MHIPYPGSAGNPPALAPLARYYRFTFLERSKREIMDLVRLDPNANAGWSAKVIEQAVRRVFQGHNGKPQAKQLHQPHPPVPAAEPATPESAPATPPVSPPTVEEEIHADRQVRRLNGKLKDMQRKYDRAMHELELMDERLEVLLNIKEPTQELVLTPKKNSGTKEAVAVALYSDWHLEERVDLLQMNGLNEYNPQIAEARAFRCFQNTLRLVQKERAATSINEMVIWLGGDFITGFIHEELTQTNWLTPTEATLLAKKLLVNGIQFLLQHGGFAKLHFICNPGNHGRTTTKLQIANSHKMSYEWMMYHDLRDIFKQDPRVSFDIPDSPFGYITVYDRVIRTFHGEAVKYGGGIGGVSIPLIKYCQRVNKQRHADYNVLGHFHQMINPTKDIMMNGSLIGLSPYAQKIGCDPEVPQQRFFLIDKERGVTMQAPIFCESRSLVTN